MALSLAISNGLDTHNSNIALLDTSMTLARGSLATHLLLHDSKDTDNFNSIAWGNDISQLSIDSH